MSTEDRHNRGFIADPATELMTEEAAPSGALAEDEATSVTEVMDPEPEPEPDPAADIAQSSSAPAGASDEPPADSMSNPVIAETRKMRAGEVVEAALPFDRKGPGATAAADPARPGLQADPDAGVEVPEAHTEAVRPKDIHQEPLPFKQSLKPRAPSADLDEVNEIVWRSRVGIDPNDLPSAQLVVSDDEDKRSAATPAPAERSSALPVIIMVAALLVGFLVVALLAL